MTMTSLYIVYIYTNCILWTLSDNKVYLILSYSLIFPWVQQTRQFTPLVLELSLIRSHLLWGEFSVFSAANAIHNSSFLVPPGTYHCWVERGGMIWEACPTPLHMDGTHPSANWAQHCLTSVIWWELVTTRPCATMHYNPITIKNAHRSNPL